MANLSRSDHVVALMESSKTEEEWTANANAVKQANGGDYPFFWFATILQSGVMRRTVAKFGMTDQITLTPFTPSFTKE